MDAIVRAIREGRDPDITIDDGLVAAEMSHMALGSLFKRGFGIRTGS